MEDGKVRLLPEQKSFDEAGVQPLEMFRNGAVGPSKWLRFIWCAFGSAGAGVTSWSTIACLASGMVEVRARFVWQF